MNTSLSGASPSPSPSPGPSPRSSLSSIRIGIDATNIRIGGGITHLLEFLGAIDPQSMGVKEVIIWGSQNTLQALPKNNWITKINSF